MYVVTYETSSLSNLSFFATCVVLSCLWTQFVFFFFLFNFLRKKIQMNVSKNRTWQEPFLNMERSVCSRISLINGTMYITTTLTLTHPRRPTIYPWVSEDDPNPNRCVNFIWCPKGLSTYVIEQQPSSYPLAKDEQGWHVMGGKN